MDSGHVENKKWVSNEVANKVVAAAQVAMRNNRQDAHAVRKLMDLVSGVKGYQMWDHRHQGLIKRIYNLERRSQFNHGATTLSSNFGVDFDDIISAFWEAVFRKLPVAATTGDTVNVRIVNGQQASGAIQHLGTINVAQRATKCNPINFLKQHGWLGVRNMLNRSYRKHIAQVCEDCGHSSNVMSKEANGENCPKCLSKDTEKFWPSGHSSYRSKKARRCNGCKYVWSRNFVRSCSECGGTNVHTDALVMNNEESMMQQASDEDTAEQTIITGQATAELNALLDDIYKSLPRDPKDPTLVTHTHNVFELLTRPEASKEMCRKCVLAAPLVCAEKCKQPVCDHDKIPDPGESCGSESMATATKCVNYSKKIAEYHGVSASLASRRVKKVRKYVAQYIATHRSFSTLDTVYTLLQKRGVL